MSEQWPPHWGDPDGADSDDSGEGLPENEQLAPDVLAEHLAEVRSALASAPMPTMPDAFAMRIGAAIAAESATRLEDTGAGDESATVRSVSPESSPAAADGGTTITPRARSLGAGARRAARRPGASRASGPAGSRPPGKSRMRLISAPVMAPLLICLVLAGFGFLFTQMGGSSSSSSVINSAASASSPLTGSAAGSAAPYSEALPSKGRNNLAGRLPDFTVTETGTRYEAATLGTQVHDELAPAPGASSTGVEASASASGSAVIGGYPVSKALAGCVYRLTSGARPSLVDRATYAGKTAYIIAVPSRVWVVGLGCTAANPELITTIALTG